MNFEWILAPKILENSIKNRSHIDSIERWKNTILRGVFAKNRGSEMSRLIKNRTKTYHKTCQHVGVSFESLWVPFLVDFGLQNPLQIDQKSIQKPTKKIISFWSDFLSTWDRFWEDFGGVLGGPQVDFWDVFWLLGPSWGQNGPKTPPRSLQDRFWMDFGSNLDQFWMIFGPILDDFSMILVMFLLILAINPIRQWTKQPINESYTIELCNFCKFDLKPKVAQVYRVGFFHGMQTSNAKQNCQTQEGGGDSRSVLNIYIYIYTYTHIYIYTHTYRFPIFSYIS